MSQLQDTKHYDGSGEGDFGKRKIGAKPSRSVLEEDDVEKRRRRKNDTQHDSGLDDEEKRCGCF